jgi:cytochrome b involved in lipid metabolism
MDTNTLAVAGIGLAAAVLVWLLISRQSKAYAGHVSQLAPKAPGKRSKKERSFGVYTREEVAKHNTREDAWIIIKHKKTGVAQVYDVTEYVDEHPGGESILAHVGGEATEGFHGPQHPDTVFVMSEEYCIGKLAEGQ